jgi:hypothetical protein
VARVLDLIGVPAERSPVRASAVGLGGNHTVSGNPDRFATGEIPIREDDAWRTGLPAGQAARVNVMALPLLHRYAALAAPRSRSLVAWATAVLPKPVPRTTRYPQRGVVQL